MMRMDTPEAAILAIIFVTCVPWLLSLALVFITGAHRDIWPFGF